MKPLNHAERNSAFWRFLLLFLITVSLLVAAIFFSIQVPMRENKELREKIAEIENQKELAERFTDRTRQALTKMAQYGNTGAIPAATYQDVNYEIGELNKLLMAIPQSQNTLYALVVRNMTDLNDTKKQLLSSR